MFNKTEYTENESFDVEMVKFLSIGKCRVYKLGIHFQSNCSSSSMLMMGCDIKCVQ